MSKADEIRLKQDNITREAHERLWTLYQKALHDLAEANSIIVKLTNSPLGANAIATATKMDVPAAGKQPIIIGIVKCPKCGQLMEVEKS